MHISSAVIPDQLLFKWKDSAVQKKIEWMKKWKIKKGVDMRMDRYKSIDVKVIMDKCEEFKDRNWGWNMGNGEHKKCGDVRLKLIILRCKS